MGADHPRCFNCGYSIAHVSAGGVCPECGARAVEEREVLDGAAAAGRRERLIQNCVVVAMVVGVLGFLLYACVP
ncbi:MAG TPA: hypothetical protein VD997_10655 [Phycisphaerales bacterium]|nr:hypothetical protein [Phycisphaerales bacterium]